MVAELGWFRLQISSAAPTIAAALGHLCWEESLIAGSVRGMHCDHRALQELRGDGAALRSAVPGQHPALGSNCSPGAPGTHTALHGDGGCGLSSLGISHPALL